MAKVDTLNETFERLRQAVGASEKDYIIAVVGVIVTDKEHAEEIAEKFDTATDATALDANYSAFAKFSGWHLKKEVR